MTRVLAALLVLAILPACSIVNPGERGIRVSFGKVSEQPLESGMYFWMPVVARLKKMDVTIQNSEIRSDAASKDMQDVHTDVAVNWSLAADKIVITFKTIGDEEDVLRRIIAPAVKEVLKAAISKRTAEEVLVKRMELKADIDEGLKARLQQYGVNMHDVSITNLSFSEGFTQAIEHKQIAEQQAKQASYVAEKAIQDAKAEVERAKGQAEAQRLLKATITSEILQQKAIEKWDGHFPQVMGSNTVPFLNLKNP